VIKNLKAISNQRLRRGHIAQEGRSVLTVAAGATVIREPLKSDIPEALS
jgi:hypothetical protein